MEDMLRLRVERIYINNRHERKWKRQILRTAETLLNILLDNAIKYILEAGTTT